MQTKCSVGVSPEVVDAIQLYFRYNAKVVYDPTKTVLNEASLIAVIQQTISDYFEENSQNFFSVVSISRMVKKILDSLVEVETITLTPSLESRFVPTPNAPSNYSLNFANPIFHPHAGHSAVVTTNDFTYFNKDGNEIKVFAEDDGFGKVKLFNIVNATKNVVEEDFGTVDYQNGVVTFNSFTIKEISGDIRVRSEIANNRLVANENYILAQDVEDSERNTTVMLPDDRPDRQIQTSTSGVSYVGTSSISSAFTTSRTSSSSSSSSGTTSRTSSSSTSSSSGGGSY